MQQTSEYEIILFIHDVLLVSRLFKIIHSRCLDVITKMIQKSFSIQRKRVSYNMAALMGRFYVVLSKGLYNRTCFIWHCNDLFQNDQQNLKKGYPQWLIVEIHFIPQFVQGNLFNMNKEITLGTEMHFFKFFIADKNNEDLSENGFLSRRIQKSCLV